MELLFVDHFSKFLGIFKDLRNDDEKILYEKGDKWKEKVAYSFVIVLATVTILSFWTDRSGQTV